MKRPQIIRFAAFVTVLAVLLGYVVYHRTSPQSPVAGLAAIPSAQRQLERAENYFTNYRLRRDQLMSKEIATLKALTQNPQISKTARNQAAATMVEDTDELTQETRIESILAGRGFPLSAATVTAHQIVVQVGGAQLNNRQVAQIANTVLDVTGMPPQDVVILPYPKS
jgi:hypothetical protein